MHPILFKIGPVTVYSYGVMLATACIVASFLAERDARLENIAPYKILDLALWVFIWGIIGARLMYVLLNLKDFLGYPLRVFALWQGGLSFYGGMVLGIGVGIRFLKKENLDMGKIADIVAPYIVLAHAIGRIGCLLNGCCFGKVTRLPWGIYFPGSSYLQHPTQIYSTLGLLGIYSFLKLTKFTFFKRMLGIKQKGQIFILYTLSYSFMRFFIEFLRGDTRVFFFGLTVFQIISVVVFLVSARIWFRLARKPSF